MNIRLDFNLAIDEYETCDGGTPIFASINGHEGVRRTEMDDFESLFYTMLDFAGVKLPWDRDDVQQSEYHKYKKNAFQVRVSMQINDSISPTNEGMQMNNFDLIY